MKVVILNVPPLRDRKSDIPLLAEHFLREFCKSNKKSIRGFSKDAMDLLINRPWPGNVRELKHSIENAIIFCDGNEINAWDLDTEITRSDEQRKLEDEKRRLESGEEKVKTLERRVISEDEIIKNIENMEINKNFSLPEFMDGIEKRIIKKVLEKNNQNISATARELKLPRDTTLRNKMNKLNIPFK